MQDEIRIVEEKLLSDNWGRLTRYVVEQRRRSGVWQRHAREVYDRGHAAVILLCDPARGVVTLVRQFRFAIHSVGGPSWLIEACAGLLDGDSPEACAIKEAEEEAGIRPANVRHLFDAYMSPGSVTERLSFFIGTYDQAARVGVGGGLEEEGEDIEVLEMPLEQALSMIGSEIVDAKTIMLLQHVAHAGLMPR